MVVPFGSVLYVTADFKVTVIQLNTSVLFDFFCSVLGADHTCHCMRNIIKIMIKKVNPSKRPPFCTCVFQLRTVKSVDQPFGAA